MAKVIEISRLALQEQARQGGAALRQLPAACLGHQRDNAMAQPKAGQIYPRTMNEWAPPC